MAIQTTELASLPAPAFDAEDVDDMRWALGYLTRDADDAERIDQLAALHQLKAAIAAAEARVMTDLAVDPQGRDDTGSSARLRRGVAEQIGLATQSSPTSARIRLGRARALVADFGCTLAAMTAGDVQGVAADAVLRETTHLNPQQRRMVDAALATRLPQLPLGKVAQAARKVAQQLDPQGALRRITSAEADRCVWVRQAEDGMVLLGARLPITSGVATYAALRAAADLPSAQTPDAARRSRAQFMADTLVERVTGARSAQEIPLEVGVLITADALLASDQAGLTGDDTTCLVRGEGGGPMPAAWARRSLTGPARAWLRRLVTDPVDGTVTSIDPRRREFTGSMRRLILARDQTCRMPYCTAMIRHADHVQPFGEDGSTTLANGQGLCESCNYLKNEPGWRQRVTSTGHAPGARSPDGPHRVRTVTPTGHSYESRPPPALGFPFRPGSPRSG